MLSSTYILDTSAWIAFIEDDPKNSEIVSLLESAEELIVSFTVLEEIAALLQNRVSSQVAKKNCSLLVSSHKFSVYTPKKTDVINIINLWNELPNKISFVDASLVWLQQQNHLPILTLDKHFKKLGCNIA